MKKVFPFVVVAMFLAIPALAQDVNIDYARGFDFAGIKTFQYVDTEESNINDNQIMHDRVVSLLKQDLRQGGLTEVESDPDIFVTYHFTSEQRKQLNTTHMGMGGYGGYWDDWGGWGGYDAFGGPMMGSSTTREYTYEMGTLVFDAYDSAEKKMIWRGSGTVTIKDKPEKQVKQVENILKKLGKRWDKILRGKGK